MMTLFGDTVPTFDALTVALLIACILYSVCFILAMRKLAALIRIRPEISTKLLLVLSLGLIALVRIMTLLLVAAMNIANVRAHYSLQPTSNNQGFYDKAMTVLFDLPNCIVVSTYTLLTLVWAECFLASRFHTESVVKWKRRWLVLYIVFNSTLYATQLILYTCIFFAHKNTVVRTVVYAAITGINFVSVFLVMLMYLYLNVRFSVSSVVECDEDTCVLYGRVFQSTSARLKTCLLFMHLFVILVNECATVGLSLPKWSDTKGVTTSLFCHDFMVDHKNHLGSRNTAGLYLQCGAAARLSYTSVVFRSPTATLFCL